MILSPLRRWLDETPISDPVKRRHAATLQVFAVALCAAIVIVEWRRWSSGHASPISSVVNAFNMAICLAGVILLRRGDYRRAAFILVVGFGLVLGLAFSFGGLQFSRDALKNIAIVLALAALLIGRRMLWWVFAGFGVALSIGYARDLGFLGGTGPHPPPGTLSGVFWVSGLSFLVLAIVLDRFGVTVQETLAENKRTTDAMRDSEELFRVAFETSPNSITIVRREDRRFIAVNEGFTRLTGWSREETVGRTAAELRLWVDPSARDKAAATLRTADVVHNFETRFRRRDGTEFLGSLFAQTFELSGRGHVLSVTRDLTASRAAEAERARLQAQLQQSQKVESIGRVAGGVAHDLNNLLTAVIGYTDLLEEGGLSESQRADLEQVRLGGQRAASLTRQLLSFARKQPIAPRDVDVNALTENLSGLLKRLLGERVEFVLRLGQPAWAVRVDPGQLEQVLMNLVVNARDAMPNGGRLLVETRALPAELLPAQPVVGLPAVDHVVIAISDTGAGMPPEVMDHLFEPFFTTKEPGKGTGLGLATCYGIVQQAGGQIAVETTPGKGSTFRVCLPRLIDAHVTAPVAPSLTADGGTETVLLVEDEPQLRVMASRILRSHGYAVLEAPDGVQAILTAGAHDGRIDLLLTDVVMPRLGGQELAQRLRATRPELRVLFASGYSDTPIDLAAHGNRLLTKPFTPVMLLNRVRQALDG